VFQIVKKLYKINLLTPRGVFFFIYAISLEGINLMAILRFSAFLYPNRTAISETEGAPTYIDLFKQSKRLASLLKNKYGLGGQKRVAVLCRNHLVAVESLFALSRLGVDIYLLNIEMSPVQLKKMVNDKKFDLIIYDSERADDITLIHDQKSILSYHEDLPSISGLLKSKELAIVKLKRVKSGRIIVLTGGTTGEFKSAGRKPSLINFINPFFALLTDINIDSYRSIYIATPIYHGFGLASLIVSTLLGSEQFILRKYKTEEACKLINDNKIEVVILVPLMLQRMLKHDKIALGSLKSILSGGAPLDSNLVRHTMQQLGDVLYNLYGTSEAGFSILAKPKDLRIHPTTIGKPIRGVSIRIEENSAQNPKGNTVGMICIKSRWVMDNKRNRWVPTGDLGNKGKDGFVFLRGRNDDMIVSGGENVYPGELEQVLMQNESIEGCTVIGIPDVEFGQRLKAFVVLKDASELTEDMIVEWLSDKVARYQMPAQMRIVDTLPITSVGKVDKKQLLLLE
jgi:fatty-acyl-CoA synthase